MSEQFNIRQFAKERDAMLEKRSVDALIDFMENSGYYDKELAETFKKADDTIKMLTLCKMITECKGVSRQTKKWAERWCYANGFNPHITFTEK